MEGYLLDDTIYSFELTYVDQYTDVVYASATRKNDEPTAELEIIKVDSETGGIPQGDASFENALYYLYADEDIYNAAKTVKYYSKGDLVATRTMDSKGNTEKITGLPLGRYKLKEGKSSERILIRHSRIYN